MSHVYVAEVVSVALPASAAARKASKAASDGAEPAVLRASM